MGFFMARQHGITLVVVVVVRGGARRGRDDEADGFGDVRDIRTRDTEFILEYVYVLVHAIVRESNQQIYWSCRHIWKY